MKTLLILMFSLLGGLLSLSAFAQSSVDLSYMFAKTIVQQKGNNCSVYSTTAFVEAACFARTGKKIKLSEASVLANHYRFYLKQPFSSVPVDLEDERTVPNRFPLTFKIKVANNIHYKSLLLPTDRLSLSGFDRDDEKVILAGLLKGNALAESELKTDEVFYAKLKNIFKTEGAKENDENHDQVRTSAANALDKLVLGSVSNSPSHFEYQTNDQTYKECLTGDLDLTYGPAVIENVDKKTKKVLMHKDILAPDANGLVDYLKAGSPVLCRKNQYPIQVDNFIRYVSADGKTIKEVNNPTVVYDEHSVVVVGYKLDETKEPIFKVRDSSKDTYQWVKLDGCDHFWVLK